MRSQGKDAHIGPIRWNGFTSGGARLFVTAPPADALRVAVEALVASGFEAGTSEFQDALRAAGSDWLAQDLRLGDVRKSWKRGIGSYLAEGTPLEFFPKFFRGATPTLVVASSRATSAGTEVVVFPHISIRGASDRGDANPLVRAALESMTATFTAAGAFISIERIRSISNDGSPAAQATVRTMLGWK